MPRTQCRAGYAKWAGPCARGRAEGQGCAVHRAAAPRDAGAFGAVVPVLEEGRGPRRGRGEMAGLRARCARPPALPAGEGAAGEVPGGSLPARLHPEGGRAAAAAGIASLAGKVLQRAVTEVLNAVYEADFKGFSYGFRPGRS